MRKNTKIAALFFLLLVMIVMFPANAYAKSYGRVIDMGADKETQDIPAGTCPNWYYIAQENTYYITGGSYVEKDCVVISGSTPKDAVNKKVIITKSCDIILDSIDVKTSAGSVIKLNPGTKVTLYLTESINSLTADNETGAGIETTGATLIIEGKKGKLTVTGKYGAGIGGSSGVHGRLPSMIDYLNGAWPSCANGGTGNTGGTVIINSGTVTAKSTYGAGIGGGSGGYGLSAPDGRNATIVAPFLQISSDGISGGNGGIGGAGATVTVNGGTVTADSKYGAGIGGGAGGNGGKGGDGGEVIVGKGRDGGHGGDGGIGGEGGFPPVAPSGNIRIPDRPTNTNTGGLTINGGSVKATSSSNVGIGGGRGGNGGNGGEGSGGESIGDGGKGGHGGFAGNGGNAGNGAISGGTIKELRVLDGSTDGENIMIYSGCRVNLNNGKLKVTVKGGHAMTGGNGGSGGKGGNGGSGGGISGSRGKVGTTRDPGTANSSLINLDISAIAYDWEAKTSLEEEKGSYPGVPFVNNSTYYDIEILTK